MFDLANNVLDLTEPIPLGATGLCGVPGSYGSASRGATTFGAYLEQNLPSFVSLNNSSLTAANWPDADASSPTRVQNLADPFGGTTATSLQDSSATNLAGMKQSVTIANDSTTWAVRVLIQNGVAGSGQGVASGVLDLTGGATPVSSSFSISAPSQNSAAWNALGTSLANNSTGNTTLTLTIRPTNSTGSSTGTVVFSRPIIANISGTNVLNPSVGGSSLPIASDSMSCASGISNGAVTFSEWIYAIGSTGSLPARSAVMALGASGNGNSVEFLKDNGGASTGPGFVVPGGSSYSSGSNYTSRAYHHVLGTITPGSQHTYVDGVEVGVGGSFSYTPNATGTLLIGSDFASAYISSAIYSNVEIWPRVLSAAEEACIYNQELPNYK